MRKIGLLVVVVAILLLGGCGEEFMTNEVETVSNGDGFSLTLASSPDNINIAGGGNVAVLVEVLAPDGSGVEGASIILTATLGTLAESPLATDIDGYASTTLAPGEIAGYCIVVATYKGMQAIVKVDFWQGPTGGV